MYFSRTTKRLKNFTVNVEWQIKLCIIAFLNKTEYFRRKNAVVQAIKINDKITTACIVYVGNGMDCESSFFGLGIPGLFVLHYTLFSLDRI